jgi:hypothetical protein
MAGRWSRATTHNHSLFLFVLVLFLTMRRRNYPLAPSAGCMAFAGGLVSKGIVFPGQSKQGGVVPPSAWVERLEKTASWNPSTLLPPWAFTAAEATMRTSDRFLKTVVFVGVVDGGVFQPLGTGFIAAKDYGEVRFQYVVTATHVIAEEKRQISVRVNRTNGGPECLTLPLGWFYHPDASRFVDVAIAPIAMDPFIYDIAPAVLRQFCTQKILEDRDIGIGDELFFPGLFMAHRGVGRNLPIMRFGTLAGMPVESVQTKDAISAYLMEGRSIGGHSGSPVFINFLERRIFHSDRTLKLPHPSDDLPYLLMGLIRGFLRAKDTGEYVAANAEDQESDLWVNSGISTIIPSWDIEETINQPELEQMRAKDLKRLRDNSADVPASVSKRDETDTKAASDENPNAREDFNSLLDAAVRKREPKD